MSHDEPASSADEKQNHAVVNDLHSRGYQLTSGSKFGADYLVYTEDPSKCHAAACLRIVQSDAPPDPVLLGAAVRSALGARKVLLLALVDEGTDAVSYMSIAPR